MKMFSFMEDQFVTKCTAVCDLASSYGDPAKLAAHTAGQTEVLDLLPTKILPSPLQNTLLSTPPHKYNPKYEGWISPGVQGYQCGIAFERYTGEAGSAVS